MADIGDGTGGATRGQRRSGRGKKRVRPRGPSTGGSRLRRIGVGLVAIGALLLAATPLTPAAADDGRIVGTLSVLSDDPLGPDASVMTSEGRVTVAGLAAEAERLGLATGDKVSVAVTDGATTPPPVPASPGSSTMLYPAAAAATVVPGSLVVLAEAPLTPLADPVVHEITLVRAVWPGPELFEAPKFPVLNQAATESAEYWSGTTDAKVNFQVVAEFDSIALSKPPCIDLYAAYDEVRLRTDWQEGPRKHLVIAIPECWHEEGVDTAGWGSLGASQDVGGFIILNGNKSLVAGVDGNRSKTLAHELGHNMSLNHSNQVRCSEAGAELITAPASQCEVAEYGGVYSVMGSWEPGKQPALGGHHSFLMGLTTSETLVDVLATTPKQTLTLVPTAGSAPGLKFARITDSAGNTYYLEYRTAVGLDATLLDPATPNHLLSGVMVTKVFAEKPGTELGAGPLTVEPRAIYMLDADPFLDPYLVSSGGRFDGDAGLPLPRPTETPLETPIALGDVSVKLTAADDAGAAIEIDFPPSRPQATVPGAPTMVSAIKVGPNSVQVSWKAPADTGGAYVTSYTAGSDKGSGTCNAITEFSCRIDNLELGMFYRFSVTATSVMGTSVSSAPSAPLPVGPIPTASPTPTPTPTPTPSATRAVVAPAPTTTTRPAPANTTTPAAPAATSTTVAVNTADPFATTSGTTSYVDPFATYTDPYRSNYSDPFATSTTSTYTNPYSSSPYTATTGTTSGTTTLATTGSEGLPTLLVAGVGSILLGAVLVLLSRPRKHHS